ncbi:hypothetical protein [Streptomyces sp. HD]|nr:hypothetical protein [Streptomyces sp. HD]MDC0772219.1 hypothetical protein [Streptomyces sp. HD]
MTAGPGGDAPRPHLFTVAAHQGTTTLGSREAVTAVAGLETFVDSAM